jgi:putative ABC transport system permease protein
MDGLRSDLRYAARSLMRAPGFVVVALLTLGLGIGANTAVFSVVNSVLVRPLPYPESARLAAAGYLLTGEYLVLRERANTFEEVALYVPTVGFNLSGTAEPERVTGAYVSPNLFATLGVAPELGRPFAAEEARPGAAGVVVLSHSLWRQRFAADPDLIGTDLLIDGEPLTVVGVMPRGFDFPASATQLWVPARVDPTDPIALWGGAGGEAIGRLRRGITVEQAQGEIRRLAPEMREANTLWTPHADYGADREVVPLREAIVGDVRTRFLVMWGAVGGVLLIACVNVANLLLARGVGRRREVAIRAALGAQRSRLLQKFISESALLALAGGIFGLLLAYGGLQLLIGALPAETPRITEIRIDTPILAFTLALSLLSGILFGVAPAVRTTRLSLEAILRRNGRAGGSDGRRFSGALVATETALAVVLVIGAGLMIRSFQELLRVDPGFQTARVVSARVTPSPLRYPTPAAQRAFYAELLERVESLPNVAGVELVDRIPLSPSSGAWAFEVEGDPYVPGTAAPVVQNRSTTPGYPRVMGIPLLRGRPLAESDGPGAPDVALINEAMAREHWPGQDPIGKRFKPLSWQDRWITVVGVVGNVRQHTLATESEPEMYRPFAQEPTAEMTLVVRTDGDPRGLATELRSAVAAVDPNVPITRLLALDQVISESVAEPRLTVVLLGLAAGLALLLGAVGIYGVVSYGVSRRVHEMGVRMALGARSGDVLRLVIGQGAAMAIVGIMVGLAAALVASRALRSLLYGVSPTDTVTFAAAPLLLLAVALLASYIPARRATRVDPMVTLRAE